MHPFTYNRIKTEYWKLSTENKELANKNSLFKHFNNYDHPDYGKKNFAITKLTEDFGIKVFNYLYCLNQDI